MMEVEAPSLGSVEMPWIWTATRWDHPPGASLRRHYDEVYQYSRDGRVHCHECGVQCCQDRIAASASHAFNPAHDGTLVHLVCESCAPNHWRAQALLNAWIARLVETGEVGNAVRCNWITPMAEQVSGIHLEYSCGR